MSKCGSREQEFKSFDYFRPDQAEALRNPQLPVGVIQSHLIGTGCHSLTAQSRLDFGSKLVPRVRHGTPRECAIPAKRGLRDGSWQTASEVGR